MSVTTSVVAAVLGARQRVDDRRWWCLQIGSTLLTEIGTVKVGVFALITIHRSFPGFQPSLITSSVGGAERDKRVVG